ncbi:MAG TPA: hypothetical protein VGO57_09550 [Verrucomicrobiae bacterium]|jgi:hypothetical protein
MTPFEQHMARLRELNCRMAACDESGNAEGAGRIQELIDLENERWQVGGHETN